jgi:hypothetical protein
LWLHSTAADRDSPPRIVAWWEARRLPFNLIVGVYGFLCSVVYFPAITSSGRFRPGEDAVESIALFAAPWLINLLYTLGWLVEIPARRQVPGLSPRFGPLLWAVGLAFGLLLMTVPAVIWTMFRVLQVIGVMT